MESASQIFGPAFNTGETSVNKPSKELGQDDFIRLMVAQLENQDPTNPLDNAEFLGQMAQFSMVEGIDDLGVSFESVTSNLFASQSMMAAQLIDREVLVDAGRVYTDYFAPDKPIQGGFLTDQTTTNARVNIYDTSGNKVNTILMGTVERGSNQFVWDGKAMDGTEAPPGNYLITAEGTIEGQTTSLPLQQYSRVTSVSVDRENSAVRLHLGTGESLAFSEINEFK